MFSIEWKICNTLFKWIEIYICRCHDCTLAHFNVLFIVHAHISMSWLYIYIFCMSWLHNDLFPCIDSTWTHFHPTIVIGQIAMSWLYKNLFPCPDCTGTYFDFYECKIKIKKSIMIEKGLRIILMACHVLLMFSVVAIEAYYKWR